MQRSVLHHISLAIFFLIFILAAGRVYAQTSPQIQTIIQESRVSNAFWAVQVRDSTGSILENKNGDKLIRPASNLKLVSSAAFFDYLGADYQYQTRFYLRGRQAGNRWEGDLIVVGSGDPSIDGHTYDDPLFLFETIKQRLADRGIEILDGNLVAFTGYFDEVPYPRGWEWDDLSYYYAPEISALSFNSNVVDLEVVADGEVGDRPQIHWSPMNTPYVQFVNEQIITPAHTKYDESYRRDLGSNTIYLRSTLPQGYYETEPLSIHNPPLYFLDTLARYLELHQIRVLGQKLVEHSRWDAGQADALNLHVHRSEPLHKLVNWLNRESDNFYTEMILKTVAAEEFDVPGSTELGLQLLKSFMADTGFDTTAVTLRDASGMAPATLVKASDLNRFLLAMEKKPYFPYYFESMSAGGENGTLSHRFRNSVLRGNFYGKTGFVSGVRSLSGYLTAGSGQTLYVTLAVNNYTEKTSYVDFVQQSILEFLYSHY